MRENDVGKCAQYMFLVQLVGLRARAVSAYMKFWWSFSFLRSLCCGHADTSVVWWDCVQRRVGTVLEEKRVLDRQHCLKDKRGFLDTCETISWKMAVVLMTDNMDQCYSAWEGCQLRHKQKGSVICAVLSPSPVEEVIPLNVNWWVCVERGGHFPSPVAEVLLVWAKLALFQKYHIMWRPASD